MNIKKKNLFVLPLLIFLLSECASTSRFYTPGEVNVSAKATLTELNQGRAYLIDKCSQCHRAPAPKKRTAEEWVLTLDKMQNLALVKNITITNEEKDLIYKYLTSEKR